MSRKMKKSFKNLVPSCFCSIKGEPMEQKAEPAREGEPMEQKAETAREGEPMEQKAERAREVEPMEQKAERAEEEIEECFSAITGEPMEQQVEPAREGEPMEQQAEPAREGELMEQKAEPAREGEPMEQKAERAREVEPMEQKAERAEEEIEECFSAITGEPMEQQVEPAREGEPMEQQAEPAREGELMEQKAEPAEEEIEECLCAVTEEQTDVMYKHFDQMVLDATHTMANYLTDGQIILMNYSIEDYMIERDVYGDKLKAGTDPVIYGLVTGIWNGVSVIVFLGATYRILDSFESWMVSKEVLLCASYWNHLISLGPQEVEKNYYTEENFHKMKVGDYSDRKVMVAIAAARFAEEFPETLWGPQDWFRIMPDSEGKFVVRSEFAA